MSKFSFIVFGHEHVVELAPEVRYGINYVNIRVDNNPHTQHMLVDEDGRVNANWVFYFTMREILPRTPMRKWPPIAPLLDQVKAWCEEHNKNVGSVPGK